MPIPDTLLHMLSQSSEIRHHYNGWQAISVGRNNVWKVEANAGGTYYAKFWNSETHYKREAFGLALATQLASHDSRFIAAPFEGTDDETGCIITREIQGTSIADLFRAAFRRDKNFWQRREPIHRFHVALNLLLDWLHTWHEQSVGQKEFLFDHSSHGMYERICERWGDEFGKLPSKSELGITDTTTNRVLLFGDVSLGNFFFDGNRVGAIDFEDIGLGNPDRDTCTLRYYIEEAFGLWKYSKDDKLLAQLTHADQRETVTLVALERAVLDYKLAHERESNKIRRKAIKTITKLTNNLPN